jgi:hypothetical protein
VKQAVLLRQPFAEGTRDGHASGADRFENGPERAHEPLSFKALADVSMRGR